MGRGDSSWQDRKHPSSNPRKPSKNNVKNEEVTETTPTVDTSVGTEGYDDTKATTAVKPPSKPQAGESTMNSGTGRNIV